MHSPARRTDWVHVWFVLIVHHHFSLSLSLSQQCWRHVPLWSPYLLGHQSFSTKQSEAGSTSAIHFQESFVAYCYKHTWRPLSQKKSDFCLQMSQGFIKTSSRLRKYGGMPSNFRYKTHKTELFWEWSRDWKVDWMDKARNSPHYLAGSAAWLRRHNINCA